jgi:hypothetical protein
MGRPEKPVNNAGGVVGQFASELRKLRAQAGNPTYREMTTALKLKDHRLVWVDSTGRC